MDYNQQNYSQPYTPPQKNTLAGISCVLGLCSLILTCTGVLPIPLGALGILFAVLSRKGRKMEPAAKLGCILSVIGLVTGLILTITVYCMTIYGAVQNLLKSMDPAELQNMNRTEYMDKMMENLYGPEYKEFFEQYGIDYDRFINSLE